MQHVFIVLIWLDFAILRFAFAFECAFAFAFEFVFEFAFAFILYSLLALRLPLLPPPDVAAPSFSLKKYFCRWVAV